MIELVGATERSVSRDASHALVNLFLDDHYADVLNEGSAHTLGHVVRLALVDDLSVRRDALDIIDKICNSSLGGAPEVSKAALQRADVLAPLLVCMSIPPLPGGREDPSKIKAARVMTSMCDNKDFCLDVCRPVPRTGPGAKGVTSSPLLGILIELLRDRRHKMREFAFLATESLESIASHAESRALLTNAGVALALAPLLKHGDHQRDVLIARYAAHVLANISMTPACRRELVTQGPLAAELVDVVAPAADSLRKVDTEVQRTCAYCLALLALKPANLPALVQFLPRLTKVLTKPQGGDREVQKELSWIIANIATSDDPEVSQRFVTTNMLPVFMQFVETKPSSARFGRKERPEICHEMCRALAALCEYKGFRELLFKDKQALSVLLSSTRATDSVDVQYYFLCAIMAIVAHADLDAMRVLVQKTAPGRKDCELNLIESLDRVGLVGELDLAKRNMRVGMKIYCVLAGQKDAMIEAKMVSNDVPADLLRLVLSDSLDGGELERDSLWVLANLTAHAAVHPVIMRDQRAIAHIVMGMSSHVTLIKDMCLKIVADLAQNPQNDLKQFGGTTPGEGGLQDTLSILKTSPVAFTAQLASIALAALTAA